MPPKKVPKIKLKTISNRDVLNIISKDEKLNNSKLVKIFSHNHQKLHQLYSKNENHIYNKDDEKYINLFPKVKRYNKICEQNITNYLNKKEENKNFFKQYLSFKKSSKDMCNDEINSLYGNLISKYADKNFKFSNKFLSGENLFKENGLLMFTKKEIEDYYHREIRKNIKNNQRAMRDIIYINDIFERLEQKTINYNSVKKNNPLIVQQLGERRRSCVAEMIEQYKGSKEYKNFRRERAMEGLNIIRMKQKEIEDDEQYIRNITKLINEEEKSKEKNNTFYPFNNNKNNLLSLNKYNNNENENNEALFVINRYTKNNFRSFRGLNRNNNTSNSFKILNKNKSSMNIYSSFYKDNDTTNSTFMNNETKMTLLFKNNKKIHNKRNSNKTSIDSSDYNNENENTNTKYNNDNDYIMIGDTSQNKKDIQKLKKISIKNNINMSSNSTGNLRLKKTKKNSFLNNNDISSIRHFNKTNFHSISSYTNMTSINNNKRLKKNDKIKNRKLSFTSSQDKINEENKNVSKFDITEDILDQKELKWDLYKKFVGLKFKLESSNNHKLKNFCSTFTSLPQILNDKINESFDLDAKIKQTHNNYVKLLMEQKIKEFKKKDEESIL